TFRLLFRQFAGLNDELMLRLYFDDTQQPVVTAWSEIGNRVFAPRQLGQGLGLPSSETLTIAMAGVDYIDIEVSGDGANVHGAFVSTVQKVQSLASIDFAPSAKLTDPFNNAPTTQPTADDTLLFGRVKAVLENGTIVLSPEKSASGFEFDLAAQPQIAVLTFEILNVYIAAPPQISVNDRELGAATLVLPDIADPAYQASIQPMQADATFHYSGWLKCQKVIPGSALNAGTNSITIQSANRGTAVAIRAVEVQLKYENNTP